MPLPLSLFLSLSLTLLSHPLLLCIRMRTSLLRFCPEVLLQRRGARAETHSPHRDVTQSVRSFRPALTTSWPPRQPRRPKVHVGMGREEAALGCPSLLTTETEECEGAEFTSSRNTGGRGRLHPGLVGFQLDAEGCDDRAVALRVGGGGGRGRGQVTLKVVSLWPMFNLSLSMLTNGVM